MRRLVPCPNPSVADGPPEDADGPYADLVLVGEAEGRPWIALGMVAALDGSVAVGGRTEALGGEADAMAFRRLRDSTDAVLVGAATVRAERYGPGAVDAMRRDARLARGLAPHPRLVVVSARVDLEPDAPLLGPRPDDAPPPLLVVPAALEADARARLAALEATDRLEIVHAAPSDGGALEAAGIVDVLVGLGLGAVLCEGGPTLAALLAAADLIDETFLTLTPVIVGGGGPRLLAPPVGGGPDGPPAPTRFDLVEAWEHDGELLLRHRRRR